jgi:hypothetical protein
MKTSNNLERHAAAVGEERAAAVIHEKAVDHCIMGALASQLRLQVLFALLLSQHDRFA